MQDREKDGGVPDWERKITLALILLNLIALISLLLR